VVVDKESAPKLPTSFDVAARAGVSRGAVSQILNGRVARFSEATQQRVLKAAEELDYRPSPAGAVLSTGRSNIIVVILPSSTFGPGVQDGIDHIVTLAAARGLEVVLSTPAPAPLSTVNRVLALRPAAVVDVEGVLSADDRARLNRAGVTPVPSSTTSDAVEPGGEFNTSIGRLMVRALVSHDARPLVYVGLDDQRNDVFGPARFDGMSREARARGLPVPRRVSIPLALDPAVAVVGSLAAELGSFAAGCFNDDVAIAVTAAARRLGLRIPQDVSVVGVDHTKLGQLVEPRLTTIDTHLAQLVEAVIAELPLLSDSASPVVEQSAHPRIIEPSLVQGATTYPLGGPVT
jgi:DNA-binding LacI/PurR family transcriptional regulator